MSPLGGQNLGKNYIFTINIVKSVDERWRFLVCFAYPKGRRIGRKWTEVADGVAYVIKPDQTTFLLDINSGAFSRILSTTFTTSNTLSPPWISYSKFVMNMLSTKYTPTYYLHQHLLVLRLLKLSLTRLPLL